MMRGLMLAALIGLAAALLTWTRPGATDGTATDPVVIQVLDNGFHTDIAVPRAALERRGGTLALAVQSLAPGDWILIGWGDAKFYVDQRPISDRLPDGARAFLHPGNRSVLMLAPRRDDPRLAYGEDNGALTLSRSAFERLAARVEASLDLSNGRPRIAAIRAGDDARFFASRETFSILHLCNHWTAGVLNASGVAVRPVPAIISGEVMRSVRAAERARKLDRPPLRD
ncbi:DUF2459 domain-containing protein [Brevundimonas vesicularis]|uniref:DUF2459 domain-containing protein n=1 Tax=Brevundimonas vesicularis TaxID=41276 RepID=A0A1Z3U8A9_BREVE|nr:DUF2459 domain-containing protein [Brevundimonas vesicularis]ASE39472.1 DUF2459 domain-containing protein [Brevundimonas vesicularis]MDX2335979.1 DUF2459 domain-containing protein [Brevundimonas vesicularis]